MKTFTALALFIISPLFGSCVPSKEDTSKTEILTQNDEPDLTRVTSLINQQQWDKAIQILDEILSENPKHGESWYYFAYAHHSKKNYSKAIEANKNAAEFSQKIRPNAYYNLACSYAMSEDLEKAQKALNNSIKAGFLNFDLLKTDPELAELRKTGGIDFPEEQSYAQIKAHNGIKIKYHTILPSNYDPSKGYPAMLAYPPGDQLEASADWFITKFWGLKAMESNWIIIVPVAPSNGWINHPSHHALNDLLKEVKSKHQIDGGKFHMVGFESGARPAAIYALMSKQYFQSLTTISSYAWERWDDGDLTDFKIMPVKMIVGEQDIHGLQVVNRVKEVFKENKVRHEVAIIPNEGRELPSLRNAALIDFIEDFVR